MSETELGVLTVTGPAVRQPDGWWSVPVRRGDGPTHLNYHPEMVDSPLFPRLWPLSHAAIRAARGPA